MGKEMVNDEPFEQIMLANAVEDFLIKLLKGYSEEYYVEVSVGDGDPGELILPIM